MKNTGIPECFREVLIPECGSLILWDAEGENIQEVNLSIKEYESLKECLIALRGYRKADELKDFIEGKVPEFQSPDHQQLAMHLDDARIIYRYLPALVVAKDLPEGWRDLLPVTKKV